MTIKFELLDVVAEAGGGGTSTASDIFETLSSNLDKQEEQPKPDKEEKETEEEEEEISLKPEDSDDEEEEESEEEEEPEEEKELSLDEEEDELELAKIPARAQIKAAYPDIFKKFPALDHIFHREKAFAEVFPTVKDARSARESLNDYNQMQEDLLNGDISGVLAQVKNTDSKAFDKIASGFLEALVKVDKNAYVEPSRVILKATLNNVYSLAQGALKKNPENKNAAQLELAVELLHEALFNTTEVTPYERGKSPEKEEDPEREKFKKEQQEFHNRKFATAHGNVTTKFNDLITRTVEKNIDPRNILTGYVKKNLVKDVREELDRQLISDKRFGGVVQKLYEKARTSDYSSESIENILTALKNKAASILPDIMRAKKGEALKGLGTRSKTRELSPKEEEGEEKQVTPRNPSKERMTRGEKKDKEDGPKPGESALDYLNRKLES